LALLRQWPLSAKRSLVGQAGHLSDNGLFDGFSDFRKCGRSGGQISGSGFEPAKKPAEAGFLPILANRLIL
jgi:hypothetical protein